MIDFTIAIDTFGKLQNLVIWKLVSLLWFVLQREYGIYLRSLFFVPLDLQCMILLYYRDMITTEAHLMTTGPRGMRVCLMDTRAVLHLLTGTIITALRSTPFLRMKGIEISVLVYQKTHKLIGNLWIYQNYQQT